MKTYFIQAEWDEQAGVWVATSDGVPGLVAESETIEALVLKLKLRVPELLEVNGIDAGGDVPFELLTRHFKVAHAA